MRRKKEDDTFVRRESGASMETQPEQGWTEATIPLASPLHTSLSEGEEETGDASPRRKRKRRGGIPPSPSGSGPPATDASPRIAHAVGITEDAKRG